MILIAMHQIEQIVWALYGESGLFGLEQGYRGFLISLGFRPEQPGHRENLGRETHY
jgi:hypothetical protein